MDYFPVNDVELRLCCSILSQEHSDALLARQVGAGKQRILAKILNNSLLCVASLQTGYLLKKVIFGQLQQEIREM